MSLTAQLGLSLAIAGPAPQAEVWGRVNVRPHPCLSEQHGVDPDQLAWLAGIELDSVTQRTDVVERRRDQTVVLECTETGVEIRLEGTRATEQHTRVIDLRGTEPSVRARLLALAMAELVAAEPLPAPPAREVPHEPTPPPEAKPPPPEDRWHLTVGPTATWFPTGRLGLFGGAIAARHRSTRRFGWRVDLGGAGGRMRAALGSVTAASISAGAHALVHGRIDRVDLFGGLGVRGGWARLRGRADDPSAVAGSRLDGGFFGPAATVGFDALLGKRGVFAALFEGGFAAVGVSAEIDGGDGPAVSGLWITGTLAGGVRF